jgi:hypothetical protein
MCGRAVHNLAVATLSIDDFACGDSPCAIVPISSRIDAGSVPRRRQVEAQFAPDARGDGCDWDFGSFVCGRITTSRAVSLPASGHPRHAQRYGEPGGRGRAVLYRTKYAAHDRVAI